MSRQGRLRAATSSLCPAGLRSRPPSDPSVHPTSFHSPSPFRHGSLLPPVARYTGLATRCCRERQGCQAKLTLRNHRRAEWRLQSTLEEQNRRLRHPEDRVSKWTVAVLVAYSSTALQSICSDRLSHRTNQQGTRRSADGPQQPVYVRLLILGEALEGARPDLNNPFTFDF